MNTVYKGNYVAKNIVDNVSKQCIAKHKADIKLHDELLVPDGDGLIDYILAQV